MRTIIEIPDEVIESLDRVGDSEQRSRAALIREAISEYLRRKSLPPVAAAFGIWKDRQVEGVAYQERLRNEWENR
jgi:predicted transcriptional regulator